jgi:lipoprotein signal peptidase
VTDSLNVGLGSLRTGIFNVADAILMLGVAVLLISLRARS